MKKELKSYCKVCGVECSEKYQLKISPKRRIIVCKYCFGLPFEKIKLKLKKK